MARLAMARDCRTPHSLSFRCAHRPRTPSPRTRRRPHSGSRLVSIDGLCFSDNVCETRRVWPHVWIWNPLIAVAVAVVGSDKSGANLRFSINFPRMQQKQPPARPHSRPRSANGTDRTRRLWSSTAGICGGTSARGGPSSAVERKCGY